MRRKRKMKTMKSTMLACCRQRELRYHYLRKQGQKEAFVPHAQEWGIEQSSRFPTFPAPMELTSG